MINKIKSISTYQGCLGLTIGLIITLGGVLYAEQNKNIDGKVDNAVMEQMIKVIELEQKYQRKNVTEQKRTIKEDRLKQDMMNEKILDAFNNINKQIIILNEKLK